jgi:hypothetical protein
MVETDPALMQPGPDTAIVGMLVWQMLAVHMSAHNMA